MKKILIIMSSLLVILSACGKASYKNVVEQTNETFTEISKERNYKLVDLDEAKEENIKEYNDTVNEEEWSYKNIHRFEISTIDDETQNGKVWIAVYEIDGDMEKFPNKYCSTKDVALYYSFHNITPSQEDLFKEDMDNLCKEIGAETAKLAE